MNNVKVCKICDTMREVHASHRCSDNKLIPGRSSIDNIIYFYENDI